MPTSINRLNGDTGLSIFQRLVWLGTNWISNKYRPNNANHLIRTQFRPVVDESKIEGTARLSSPSRLISNLFYEQFDWAAVRSELNEINVFDAGCGRGELAERINSHVEGFSSYLGIDPIESPEWGEVRKSGLPVQFSLGTAEHAGEHIASNSNLFVSQSAMEHFPDDLEFFRQIHRHVSNTSNSVIQIHLFPSAACLRLYRVHGLRHYTPRTVSKIVRIFDDPRSYSVLYDFGGKRCNDLHYKYVTRPTRKSGIDRRETEPENYFESLVDAINADSSGPINDPSFHALVIHSNYTRRVFDPNSVR